MIEINNLDDIISLKHGSLLYDEIDTFYRKKNYQKVIEKINEWYNNIKKIVQAPHILTDDEINKLKKIDYNYQKEYSSLLLKNKLTILVFKNEIEERVKFYIEIFNDIINKMNDLHHLKVENSKKKWRRTFYTCECGKEIQKNNRRPHMKSVFHTEWLKANGLENEIIIDNNPWHNRTYLCVCGKYVQNANKHGHEKSKYHKNFIEGLSSGDNVKVSSNDVVKLSSGDNENIQMKIEELSSGDNEN
jgi:hypothetical protein